MHRATAITLVLMGGGVATLGVAGYEQRLRHGRACQAERAINPGYTGPDCRTGGGAGSSGHSGSGGSHNGGTGGSSAATSARGGFGATGASHAGGGG